MRQTPEDHKPILVQAPVRALDPDGVAVVSSGTAAFAIGALSCWLLADTLVATGRGWYLYVAITGTVIGLLGLAFGIYRGRSRKRRPSRAILDDGPTLIGSADEDDPTQGDPEPS